MCLPAGRGPCGKDRTAEGANGVIGYDEAFLEALSAPLRWRYSALNPYRDSLTQTRTRRMGARRRIDFDAMRFAARVALLGSGSDATIPDGRNDRHTEQHVPTASLERIESR